MSRSEKIAAVVAALTAGLIFVLLAARFLAAGLEAIDDAYISFRYARHLLEGHGLVFNPGEEAVQGYTNFLWTLLIAAGMGMGIAPLPFAAACGIGAGALATAATAWFARRHLVPAGAAAAVAPVLLLANQGMIMWSARGLETGLFTCLVLLAGLAYLGRGPERSLSRPASLLLALAALTRPEGGLAMAITVAHLLASRRRLGAPLTRRGDLAALALFAAPLIVWGVWSTLTYGTPIPNTFGAKVGTPWDSMARGAQYLGKFALYGTGLPLLLLAASLLPRRRTTWMRSYAALLCAGWGVYVAAVGGDVFPAYRFLVPVLPWLYLLVADGVAALEERGAGTRPSVAGRGIAAVAVLLLLVPLALQTLRPSAVFAWREWRQGNAYTSGLRMVGRWLREHVPEGTWIAVNPAGALPYESHLPTIDMLGLNDREIARTEIPRLGAGRLAGHEKGNGASVLRRRPEIILVGGVQLDPGAPSGRWTPKGRSERELAASPETARLYRLESHRMPDGRYLTFLRLAPGAPAPDRP